MQSKPQSEAREKETNKFLFRSCLYVVKPKLAGKEKFTLKERIRNTKYKIQDKSWELYKKTRAFKANKKSIVRIKGKLSEKKRFSGKAKKKAQKERNQCARTLMNISKKHENRLPSELASLFKKAGELPSDSQIYFYGQMLDFIEKYEKSMRERDPKGKHLEFLLRLLEPKENYRVRPSNNQLFSDGHIEKGGLELHVKGIGPVVFMDSVIVYDINGNRDIVLRHIQGVKHSNIPKANRLLGKPCWKVLVEEIIQSAKPLFGQGIDVRFPIDEPLNKAIAEAYLLKPKPFDWTSYIDFEKPAVRAILSDKTIRQIQGMRTKRLFKHYKRKRKAKSG